MVMDQNSVTGGSLARLEAQHPVTVAIEKLALAVCLLAAIDGFFLGVAVDTQHGAVIALGDVAFAQILRGCRTRPAESFS